MKTKFFIVQALNPNQGESELNTFLAQAKVLTIDKQFVANGGNSYWSICVNYLHSQTTSEGNIGLRLARAYRCLRNSGSVSTGQGVLMGALNGCFIGSF